MGAKKPYQLGSEARKVEPKLRMIANGDVSVNAVRAKRCAGIAVALSTQVVNLELSIAQDEGGALGKIPPRGTVGQPSESILANVFIATDTLKKLDPTVVMETGRVGTVATATIPLSKLKEISQQPSVRSISIGQRLTDPDPTVTSAVVGPPTEKQRLIGAEDKHKSGERVLVGIIDVQGFDFAHPDFVDSKGKTRFEAIWDQGAASDGTAPHPYGRVISKTLMNDAIKASVKVGAPAVELEPQSVRAAGSHGTHVASIAAGNLGVARRARIAAVLVSLGPEDADPRRSFYDSTRIAHAVDYLLDLGNQLNCPVSINISLGTNGHAHDESAPVNRWIDSLLTTHGRSICVAAGNAGQEKATGPDDMGYVMGRIHTAGQIAAADLDADIQWTVAGRDSQDFSENELEFWFSAQDRFAVSLRTPQGKWFGPIEPREFMENKQLPDGTFFSIYNELYHAANGSNYIGIYLSPNLKSKPNKGVQSGIWTARLHGREIRDGRYHGWIERDDPHNMPPRPGVPSPLAFPSFFTEKSNVDNSSISTLACGQRVIAVANLDLEFERVNMTSSQGPTRDGRHKPDVAAPGTDIIAASGFTGETKRWVAMTGTSMASPYVCGVAALMLATKPNLSAAQINGIIQRTSKPLPGADFTWRNDAGFGKIDPEKCVLEAYAINQRVDKTK